MSVNLNFFESLISNMIQVPRLKKSEKREKRSLIQMQQSSICKKSSSRLI